jgi:hypothetical protein
VTPSPAPAEPLTWTVSTAPGRLLDAAAVVRAYQELRLLQFGHVLEITCLKSCPYLGHTADGLSPGSAILPTRSDSRDATTCHHVNRSVGRLNDTRNPALRQYWFPSGLGLLARSAAPTHRWSR